MIGSTNLSGDGFSFIVSVGGGFVENEVHGFSLKKKKRRDTTVPSVRWSSHEGAE